MWKNMKINNILIFLPYIESRGKLDIIINMYKIYKKDPPIYFEYNKQKRWVFWNIIS